MMDSCPQLDEILEKIVEYTSIDPTLRSNFRNGLVVEEIESKLVNSSLCALQEVRSLYQWHDGINNSRELFHYHTFLPLDEALAIRKSWIESNNANNFTLYNPELLPLFEFEGEYYCIECTKLSENSGSIWFVYHDTSQVYNSLTTMLFALLECYETGAYQPSLRFYGSASDPEFSYIETEIDRQRVAEIKLKHNPVRQETFNWLTSSNIVYDHP